MSTTTIRRSVTGATALLAMATGPLWAHGGHDAGWSADAVLHAFAHLLGQPLTWVAVAAAAGLLAMARSRGRTAAGRDQV